MKDRHQAAIEIPALALVLFIMLYATVSSASTSRSADRAVDIARQSRDQVERNSKRIKESSSILFSEFAQRTVELQKLLDTRANLRKSGFLTKGDPDGEARLAHINGKILMEVGALKQICDKNLDGLLYSLEAFDDAVADSLVDSQATRSMNSNYELALNQYLKKELTRYERSSQEAMEILKEYQDENDPRVKERILKKYNRAKRRLVQIDQRRMLYESRVKAAAMNQKITGMIREKIRTEGHGIPTKFREVMTDLYSTFAKVTPMAEIGGTGSPELLTNLGFTNAEEVKETLEIVDDAIKKLDGVLDEMVNDVMAGLGEIQVVNTRGGTSESFSVEEEMEFLHKQRNAWQGQMRAAN